MRNKIVIKGAKEHNLKNVDLEIPRDKLIVFTGVSGSGKSSLAFDTIYADGQRRYVESLSSYARQFLGQMNKPNVDFIEGLSPAISIDQKTTSKNPRSTVGTVTEIYDYLRLLYANIGIPHCPICGKEIKHQSIDQIINSIMEIENGTKFQVLAPIARGKKGAYKNEFEKMRKEGYVRVRVDGKIFDLNDEIIIDKNQKHNIEVIIDRLIMKDDVKSRLTESVETALLLANGLVIINIIDGNDLLFSQNFTCVDHTNISIPEMTPRMFSFNSPFGACPTCTGLGTFLKIDPDLIVPDKNLSIKQGAIKASGWNFNEGGIGRMYIEGLAKHYNFSLDVPFKELPKKIVDIIFYGTGEEKVEFNWNFKFREGTTYAKFEGIINNLERKYKDTESSAIVDEISACMSSVVCPNCKGERLKKEVLAVTIAGKNISEFCKMSIEDSLQFILNLKLTSKEQVIAENILKEIKSRLQFLKDVGLPYLTLARAAGTLSGGESQRIRLATQIGSSLMGVIYILDEPSIGLHQRDNHMLIETLKHLKDLGNTVIVVEHDEDTMEAADFIVDVGPGAGVNGGKIVFAGTVDEIKKCEKSITGLYLSGKNKILVPTNRRKGNGKFIKVINASENNLKNISVKIPLGTFTVVTGVSGSGKSTLVNEILYKGLQCKLNNFRLKAGKHKEIIGYENIDKIIDIDQSPIGRTPRSNPATYTGLFTDIRELFAATNQAKLKGFNSSRFSFNVKGGRCEACKGDGIIKIEMHFLPDVFVPCEVCNGMRYNAETLAVKYKDKNIYDVLEMTVEEALKFFYNIPKIKNKLQTLFDVGLGYIKIGQPGTTLSGGEAQRLKLASELYKKSTGKTLYILDEPTTGLHTADVEKLLFVLQKIVDTGNTVVVIEHNLDVIKNADYIIDLGPEGGNEGGDVVAVGTPEEIAQVEKSYTGQFIKF